MKTGIKEILEKDKHFFGLPNILTFARIFFLPFIVYFLSQATQKGDRIAIGLMLLACVTDFLDGYFARKLKMRSVFGTMLDPLVDKITVAVVMLTLAAHKELPYWFVFIVIGRDISILGASLYVIKTKKFVAESNLLGKFTAASFALVIILYTVNIPIAKDVAIGISLILVPLSLIKYFISHKENIVKQSNVVKEKMSEFIN
ncbi:CDP-diacylglycerol--glycerol-3-phosphate 3-phosphatidyltransferase [candidate division KSB1 bacterium]|nr:CDP-diacylglycerol--glycerol-3-phosphate 3-phosphatidyltransferase [candidate division KSB1 bacterium]